MTNKDLVNAICDEILSSEGTSQTSKEVARNCRDNEKYFASLMSFCAIILAHDESAAKIMAGQIAVMRILK